MSKRGKRILVGIMIIIILVALVIGANVFVRNQFITSIDIKINYGKTDTIITKEEIYNDLYEHYGVFEDRTRKEVDKDDIEGFLTKKPYIEKVEVFQTLRGVLKVEIDQRQPVLRVYTYSNKQYYIDREGKIIEISQDEATDVIVASGNLDINSTLLNKGIIDTININEKKGLEKNLSKVFFIAQRLRNDSVLNYQIDQIYLNKNGKIELIPKVGYYVIKIDQENDLETQLIKLSYLYKEGFTKVGWDNYLEIDLRYRNQVVCTKK